MWKKERERGNGYHWKPSSQRLIVFITNAIVTDIGPFVGFFVERITWIGSEVCRCFILWRRRRSWHGKKEKNTKSKMKMVVVLESASRILGSHRTWKMGVAEFLRGACVYGQDHMLGSINTHMDHMNKDYPQSKFFYVTIQNESCECVYHPTYLQQHECPPTRVASIRHCDSHTQQQQQQLFIHSTHPHNNLLHCFVFFFFLSLSFFRSFFSLSPTPFIIKDILFVPKNIVFSNKQQHRYHHSTPPTSSSSPTPLRSGFSPLSQALYRILSK